MIISDRVFELCGRQYRYLELFEMIDTGDGKVGYVRAVKYDARNDRFDVAIRPVADKEVGTVPKDHLASWSSYNYLFVRPLDHQGV